MAAAALATTLQIISVFSGVTNLVGFLDDNFPKIKNRPQDSSVRIAVALNGDKGIPSALRHAAGEAPMVQAFNENQHLCGATYKHEHPYIHSGSFLDMVVYQGYGPGEQATSLQIIPTKNELCIAYITQEWADGSHRGWLGDMGRGCGRDWYYSNIVVGDNHKPTCTWIDLDHTRGITTAALQIHMQDFTAFNADYNKDPHYYCEHPTMLFQAHAEGYKPKKVGFWDGSDSSASAVPNENDGDDDDFYKDRRRGLARRSSGLSAFSHLVASPHDRHSARELCESEISHGPDFLSFSERIFCDMDTKMHWPLCNGTAAAGDGRVVDAGCYHWDTHSLVLGAESQARNYSHVVEWE